MRPGLMKNIRRSKAYKNMGSYMAVGLAEGFESGSEREVQAAWQFIIDTAMYRHLQGWFGRQAQSLIQGGICKPPKHYTR